MRNNAVDWESIEHSYKNTDIPIRVIAKAHDVSHSTIIKKAKKLNWKRISQSSGATKKVTTVTSEIADNVGKKTGDEEVIKKLRDELNGVFALLFFDVVKDEMSKKYYTYDYFSVFIAAEYFQKMMDVRKHVPKDGVAISANGQSYVSGETNVYISMANNFMKVTKDLGLSPLSRGRATLKMVEETKTKSLFDLIEYDNSIEV